jgi:hypothetical protein
VFYGSAYYGEENVSMWIEEREAFEWLVAKRVSFSGKALFSLRVLSSSLFVQISILLCLVRMS